MDKEALKPCPFCGGSDIDVRPCPDGGGVGVVAACEDCGGSMLSDNERALMDDWNARALSQGEESNG